MYFGASIILSERGDAAEHLLEVVLSMFAWFVLSVNIEWFPLHGL